MRSHPIALHRTNSWYRGLGIALSAVVLTATVGAVTRDATAAPAAETTAAFNYAEALQKAVWFYDAQRLGKLPADNRVSWRGDSFLTDGKDVGLDLVGGFADAGDHIKATFPLVHALGALAWGYVEWPKGYETSGQDKYLLDNLRWGMDYLIKAHPAAGTLVTELADPTKDHQVWASAEVQTYPRETYLMKSGSCWGADLADSTAATFAAAAMAFKSTDSTYAATLLSHAKQLYATTESSTKAMYHSCTPVVQGFYQSWSGYWDEMVWGSLWLYRATGDSSYLTKAKSYYGQMPKSGQSPTDPIKFTWTYDWDDKTAASFILMAALTGDATALADATKWADYNAGSGVGGAKVKKSPGGEAFYGEWGSLRYSSGAAMIALVLADSGRLDATRNQQLQSFAFKQINYILGDNPSKTSYMVGFGAKYIKRPHHRTAHGPWSNNYAEPVENRHILYGALIGGPTAADDNYGQEDRNAFQKAEVALDYNAGMTSALARLVQEFGGSPLANFPPAETKDDEIYMTASLNQASSDFVELKTIWYNHTAWPARFTKNVSFRYYFTLASGQSPSGVKLTKAYEQCADPAGPTQHSGNVYYVTIDCKGQDVGPVGQSESRRENQFRITFPGTHDYKKDWSFTGVSTSQNSPVVVKNIPMYDAGKLIWGSAPSANPDTSESPSDPTTPPEDPTTPPSDPTSPPAGETGGCAVVFKANSWSTGFTNEVTITNGGPDDLSGWTLTFTLPSGQTISSSWNVTLTGTSGQITAKPAAHNSSLPAGSSVAFGYQGTLSGGYSSPTAVSLNGASCTVG